MPRAVSPNDPRPPYVQIADDLRRAIRSGELAAGERLPSGRELAAQYDVAPMTIQQAIRVLRDDGVVESFQGRGVFVRATTNGGATRGSTDLAVSLRHLQDEVTSLAARVDSGSNEPAIDELREEVSGLRRQVGVLQTQLIDLYARVGQPYPREDAKPQPRPGRRAVGE